MLTSQRADFPNFLIIGANKGGTTSLYAYLEQHPDIMMSRIKEPMFFLYWKPGEVSNARVDSNEPKWKNWKPISDPGEYRALFNAPKEVIAAGEASTAYLANPQCAQRIHAFNPGMKIIAILREPVSRAFSNYLMYVRMGHEEKTFQQTVEEEMAGKRDYLPQGRHYLSLGLYCDSLKEYVRVFGREQLRIYFMEDLIQRPQWLLKDMFGFLGADQHFLPDLSEKFNVSGAVTRSGPLRRWMIRLAYNSPVSDWIPTSWVVPKGEGIRLDAKARERLVEYYRGEVLKLQELTGRDLSLWLDNTAPM